MRCVICHRPMAKAAVTVGRAVFGPKCAQRAGLAPAKERRAAVLDRLVVRDERTRDWVREAAHG